MSILDAVKQGWDLGNQISGDYYATKAQTAAREKYGPMAGDPGLFSAMTNIDLAQQGNTRAGAQETRDQTTFETNQTTVGRQNDQQATLNGMNALKQAIDSGTDPGQAFDDLDHSGFFELAGIDPATKPQLRESLIANPGLIDQYLSGLSGPASPAQAAATAKAQEDAAAKAAGQQEVSNTISQLRGLYGDLKESGSIPNADLGVGGSIAARVASSGPGQFVGSALGTEASRTRQSIAALTPNLLIAVKQANELGAKMFDSNKDMEFFMSMMGDPSRSYEANMAALDEFDRKYGAAQRGEAVTPIDVRALADGKTPSPSDTVPATVQLQPGTIVPGVGRFKGGDVTDINNYEQVP